MKTASRKTFFIELIVAIASLILAATIYTQYRVFQKRQRAESSVIETPMHSSDINGNGLQ